MQTTDTERFPLRRIKIHSAEVVCLSEKKVPSLVR